MSKRKRRRERRTNISMLDTLEKIVREYVREGVRFKRDWRRDLNRRSWLRVALTVPIVALGLASTAVLVTGLRGDHDLVRPALEGIAGSSALGAWFGRTW